MAKGSNKETKDREEKSQIVKVEIVRPAKSYKIQFRWGTIISLVIAGFSLFYSFWTNRNTDKQFEIINQGYIDLSLLKATFTAPDSLLDRPVQENLKRGVGGMNFGFKMKNVGNIPLKFDVKTFDVLFDGVKVKGAEGAINTNGIIYPKSEQDFVMSTTFFDKLMTSDDLVKKNISTKILIEYTDVNNTRIKVVERTYDFRIHQFNVEYQVKNIFDRI